MRILPLLFCLVIVQQTSAQPAAPTTTTGKKLIQYGWDSPDTAFLRKNLARIEASPFDGIILTVRSAPTEGKLGGGADALGWLAFGAKRFTPDNYQHTLDDLAAAQSKKLTDNFIALISHPEGVGFDWFDDAQWDVVLHNVRALAMIAKKGNCAGIMFDPEEYAFPLWTYARLPEPHRAKHTHAEYVKKVRQRGNEFIKAINAEFPDITILTLFGPYLYAQNVNAIGAAKTAEANYNLLGPFYDGILESAADHTTLVDGYEQSYGYKNPEEFTTARRDMIDRPRALCAVPDKFTKHVRPGYGLWLDNQSGAKNGWFKPQENKNHFSPAEWQTALHHALLNTDKYVWIYNERARWWDKTPGEPYVIATHRARIAPAD